jgi:hypothetical protein
MRIKKGNPVEFTRQSVQHHTIGEGEFGIAIEDEQPDLTVKVELGSGEIYTARYIHAYAWGGWLPEDLEQVYLKHNPDSTDYFDSIEGDCL